MIKILYLEDHEGYAEFLKTYFDGYNIKTTIANDANTALNILKNEEFDIILVDLFLGDDANGGIKAMREFLNITIAPMLALTASKIEGKLVNDTYDAGACGFETKDNWEKLPEMFRKILDKTYPQMYVAKRIKLINLTDKDILVIKLSCKNFTIMEIAESLKTTESSIKTRKSRIREKMGIENIEYIYRRYLE